MVNWILNSVFWYPVSEQQVTILNLFGFSGDISLWVLRLVTFAVLALTLYWWRKLLGEVIAGSVDKIVVMLVAISPIFFVIGFIYPINTLKLLVFVIGVTMGLKNKWWFAILAILLMLFNWQVLGQKASVYYKLNLKDAQNEVTKRISSEDSLVESIAMPLWWRRVTYNKYFFVYKQILAENLAFFDMETIFFQEINPTEQKSMVIFYWPEIYLFVLGLYYLYNLKNQKFKRLLLFTIVIAWVDYVFSDGPKFLRLSLVIFPLSMIIALAFYNLYLLVKKSKVLPTLAFTFVFIFIGFGFINSFYDLGVRTQYWLDNRPIAYDFWYQEIFKLDLTKYNKVYVTSLIGDSDKYCKFYLGKICESDKFVFESFDLSKEKSGQTVYAGFGGEFVGPDFKNNISGNWEKTPLINIISKKSLLNTIANQFGNDIGVGIVN